MKIPPPPAAHPAPSKIADIPDHAPGACDLNWFNSLLNTPSAKGPFSPTSDNPFTNLLSQRSALLQALSNKAARALQKLSNSTDPIDIIKSTRAMSASHLETVLSAKIISKTTQAIEKLTNLS